MALTSKIFPFTSPQSICGWMNVPCLPRQINFLVKTIFALVGLVKYSPWWIGLYRPTSIYFLTVSIIQHCNNWTGCFYYKNASVVYFAGKLETDNLQLASGKHISGVDGGVGGGMGVILGSSIRPTFSSFRMEGRVTTSCLWHACRAVTIGTLLIGLGITMVVLGEILKIIVHWCSRR